MSECALFIEGLQGSGKSTLMNIMSQQLTDYKVYREGDYCPTELAWCARVSNTQYKDILNTYPSLYNEICNKTVNEDSYKVICYTKIITDIEGFHKNLEKYEIYNGNLCKTDFERVVIERFIRWNASKEIFECSIFQNIIENQMLYLMMSDDEIICFYKQIKEVLKDKKYKILYLNVEDIETGINIIRKERSDDKGNEMWFPLMIRYIEESPYGKENSLIGMKGLLKHLSRRKKLEHRLLKEVFDNEALIITSKDYEISNILDLI